MMICKADFEELFPELFEPDDTRIAHGEVDGGLTRHGRRVGAALGADPVRQTDFMDSLVRAGLAVAMMNHAAAHRRPSVMRKAFDRMTSAS